MNMHETEAGAAAPQPTAYTFLLWYTLTVSVLFNIIYFSMGVISPHYDMMRQPISDLALLKHGWIQSVNFVVFGTSMGAFAVALRMGLRSGVGATLIPLFHWFTGLGLVLAGLFIHTPVHTAAMLFAFISLLISFLLFAVRFTGDRRWKGWAIYTLLSVILMVALFARSGYGHIIGGPYAGVFERLIVVTRLVWVIIFTLKLLSGIRLGPVKQNGSPPGLAEETEHVGL